MPNETSKKWLQVIAKRDSFRRAGFTFSESPTLVDPSKLKKEQVEALMNEKMLFVSEVDEPKKEETKK